MGDTKRKMLTPEERIAKAKAELEALEKAQAERNQKAIDSLVADRAKLQAQIDERSNKIEVIDSKLENLGYEAPAEDESDAGYDVDASTEAEKLRVV